MKHREVTGSLIERNGRYTAMLNLYDESGKRRQKSIALGIPVKGNKRKALARLEELKREYSEPATKLETAKKDSPLFADFLQAVLHGFPPCIALIYRVLWKVCFTLYADLEECQVYFP